MQQRRVRLGDILDDYCPRERRITNHAVVAMIDDDVKQTRCATCDAEHEYKQARVPAPRRKKTAGALVTGAPDAASVGPIAAPEFVPPDPPEIGESFDLPAEPFAAPPDIDEVVAPPSSDETRNDADDEWPVHRPLIRATLPRPEGQTPERKEPDFTIRQNGRFDRGGNRHRGNRHGRGQGSGQARFNQSHSGGPSQRSGSGRGQGAGHHSDQSSRHGNRPPAGQRGGGRSGGQGRGPNSGHGRGRRGR
ncbi:MAG TPA: hypothetical protein VKB50_15175 [Vicinamibacterales bacterium]|nr:hypothetical protein [Vicinamibacterales bacterium]